MSNVLLIDADVLCYQIAFANQDEVDWDGDGDLQVFAYPDRALARVNATLDGFREKLKGDETIIVLSDRKENFRKDLDPTYKLGRNQKGKPELWGTIRDFLEFGDHGLPVRQLPRLEGDDVLGLLATGPKYRDRSIVLSIDKDMRTVPCRLYLFNKPELGVMTIDEEDAYRWLMYQTLWGDAVDEYPGCPRMGEKTAADVIADAGPVECIWERVVEEFAKWDLDEDYVLHQARLAFILQYGYYNSKTGGIKLWTPPKEYR